MLSTFPLCIEGWLAICDTKVEDLQEEDLKYSYISSTTTWTSKFCLLMENDSKFYVFNDEKSAQQLQNLSSIAHCRLDNELSAFRVDDFDDVTSSDLTNLYNKRVRLNPLLSQVNNNKSNSRGGLFRNGSRFFGRGKSNSKLSTYNNSNKDNKIDNSQPTKSVSTLKRSISLSRINRKKTEEKPDCKTQSNLMKNSLVSQSTGDLTLSGDSSSTVIHYLEKETILSDLHASIVGGRQYCFRISGITEELDMDTTIEKKEMNLSLSTRYFAASSNLEKQCWMKRIQQIIHPNLENESRINNSLKLTLYETKCLPVQKRKYYCTVSQNNTLYAKTTTKMSSNDGCVFWAEELNLNNLPNFKTLTVSLYKEAESVKDFKRKKKKHHNQCIGQKEFSIDVLKSKPELQSWYYLKSPDFRSDHVQLRIKIRFQSLKVLKNSAYNRMYDVATNNYLELIQSLEKNIPIKLKEEIANCLVNIHEKNGSIIQFLIDLISEEIDDIDHSSMTLRANTIVTKIIESHMKLVGFQYLHDMLYPIIYSIMCKDETIEVDPSRYDVNEDQKSKLLIENQHNLTAYLKHIWNRIYNSKSADFPRQLKATYVGWRQKLMSKALPSTDSETIENHCDVILSGCIFLRLICPAILAPHLFGLISYFPDKSKVQRTLTLVAKSLQTLANFSTFGEKERFMTFLNPCFRDENTRMHEFLRSISSFESTYESQEESAAVINEIHYYGVATDLPVEMARLYNCLMSDSAKELIDNSAQLRNKLNLSEIMDQISEQLKNFVVSPSKVQKKIQMSKTKTIGQRRTLSTQFLNCSDLGNLDRNQSPPLLRSPVSKVSDPNPLSVYKDYDEIDWALCSFNDNVYDSRKKSISNDSPILKRNTSNVNIPVNRRANYNMKDYELIKGDALSVSYRSSSDESNIQYSLSDKRSKTPIKLSQVPPKRPVKGPSCVIYDTVKDIVQINPIENLYQDKIDTCDREFYRENPLYGLGNISEDNGFIMDTGNKNSETINRYFNLRDKINTIENGKEKITNKFGNEQSMELSLLYKELDAIKKGIHSGQLRDLKQLQTMLDHSTYDTTVSVHSPLSSTEIFDNNTICNTQNNILTTEALDNVINSISQTEKSLSKAQDNLRNKQIKKPKYVAKPQPMESKGQGRVMHTVTIDIADYNQCDVTAKESQPLISRHRR